MKDAKGHGSNAHNAGIAAIGKIKLHPNVNKLAHVDGSVKPTTGKSPKSGYMVSIPGHSMVVSAAAIKSSGQRATDMLSRYAAEHAEALQDPKAHIGRWQEPGTDNVYLDVSHRYGNKSAAINAGKAHNQIAIWDVKHGHEIQTGGTGA